MSDLSSRRRSLMVLVLLTATALAVSTAGCGLLNRGGETPGQEAEVPEQIEYGPCLPMYGEEVLSSSMSGDGGKALSVSKKRPDTIDAGDWGDDDRALYLTEFPAEGAPTVRLIARSWQALDEIPAYATPSDEEALGPLPIPEQMADVQLARSGDRFVVAVSRNGVYGRYAKLYTGTVPAPGSDLLSPESGLTLIPINDYQGTEGIVSYTLAADGSKVAAVVGSQGEIRIFDLGTSQLSVYDQGEKGQVVVRHDLPPAEVSINQQRQPAVASTGTMYLRWSPPADRLTIGMSLEVSNTGLLLLDAATGKVTVVHRFENSTIPQAAWSSDGQSLFVMTTKLSAPQIFGDTEIRRLAAAQDGREVSQGGKLTRPLGYRGEPGALVGFGDDEHFVFVWEGQLWRLDMPGGVPAQATYVPLTPSTFRVQYTPPSVSLDAERVGYVALTDYDTQLGLRTYALDADCPITSTEVEGGAPTGEPEATTLPAASPIAPSAAVTGTVAVTPSQPVELTVTAVPGATGAPTTAPATEAPTEEPASATATP